MRFLIGLWTNLGVFKTHKRSFVAGRMSGPNLFHRAQVIVGDLAALFAIDAEHFIFARLDRRRRADADADVEPAFAEHVERGDLFGGEQRIAAGHHDASDAEAHRANQSGEIGQRSHRFVKVRTHVARVAMIRAGRNMRAMNFVGPGQVIVNPNRIETERLRFLSDFNH